MKAPRWVQRIAAVLVAIFLLLAVWAAYSLYEQTRSDTSTVPPTVAVYGETAANEFVAALRPSALYNNSTEIAGGNITLFSALTKWINVSLLYSVVVNRSATIGLHESFEVVLSDVVWSKTIFVGTNQSDDVEGHSATLATTYALNVSHAVAVADAINTQIGYPSTTFIVSLVPSISGTIAAGAAHQSFSDSPRLNLTFAGPLITPKGLDFSENGTVLAVHPPAAARVGTAPYAAVILLAGACAGSAWIATRPTKEGSVPLDEIIAPYEEIIAETAVTPKGEVTIPVAQFPDLAKIADTLGKPILRPKGGDPARAGFVVLDGPIAYAYFHQKRAPKGDADTPTPDSIPLVPIVAQTGSSRIARLQTEVNRLKGRSLDPRTSQEARRRVRRAIDLIHARDELAADREIDDLSRLLDRAELRSSGPRP